MSTKFDSIFTDRILTNRNDQGNNLINLSTELNSKFWVQIKEGNNLSLFFKIKKFTPEDSKIITDSINSKKDVFFDKNGHITIREPNSTTNIFQWKNFLSKQEYTANKFDNIFIRKDGDESKQQINSLPRSDFILSNNSNWVLYTLNNICYILYNPIHRKSFKNFYNTLKSTEYQDSEGNMNSLFNIYCKLQKKNNTMSDEINQYSDRSCNCIIQEDGIDDMSGVKINDVNFRSQMRDIYFCKAPSCDSDNLEISENSFMYGDDGYKKRRINRVGSCPSISTTICSLAINSAGNTNLVGTNIGQECGVKAPTSTTTTTPTTTKTPVDNGSIVSISNISIFVKSSKSLINDQTFKNKIIENILKTDISLSTNDVNIEIEDLGNMSYKIDILLSKIIQVIKDNKISNIFTSEMNKNFSISISKEFEISDLPTQSTKQPTSSNSNLILIISVIIVIIVIIIIIIIMNL